MADLVEWKAEVVDGEVLLWLAFGKLASTAVLSPDAARDLAQALLAAADEAMGPGARY